MISADIQTVMPEIVLAVYAMLALLAAVYTTKDKMAPLLTWTTSGLFVLLAFWISAGEGTTTAFDGMFNNDGFARFAKITVLLSAAAVLLMSEGYMQRRGLLRFEYPILVALSVVGMMVMVSAGDLMALYLILYAIGRILLETVRLDSRQVAIGNVSLNIAIATLVSIFIALIMLLWRSLVRYRLRED